MNLPLLKLALPNRVTFVVILCFEVVSRDKKMPAFLSYASPKGSYRTPKYPIVLCHGFSGFDQLFMIPAFDKNYVPPLTDKFKSLFNKKIGSAPTLPSMDVDNHDVVSAGKYLIEYWNGIKSQLEEVGCTVLVAKVPPFARIETRAHMLDEFIVSQLPNIRKQHGVPEGRPIKLNLVAHSMGGLDCRYLIHYLQKKKRDKYQIVSLTTISTPHRGTSAADFALEYSPESLIRNYFPSVFQLSTSFTKVFNRHIHNDPDVKYFSYASQFTPNPASMFLVTWKIVKDKEGPNDGLVSVKSAKWAKFMGCLDDVDHADLINWMGPVKMAKMALGIPNFNPKWFYMDIMNNLAAHGL